MSAQVARHAVAAHEVPTEGVVDKAVAVVVLASHTLDFKLVVGELPLEFRMGDVGSTIEEGHDDRGIAHRDAPSLRAPTSAPLVPATPLYSWAVLLSAHWSGK